MIFTPATTLRLTRRDFVQCSGLLMAGCANTTIPLRQLKELGIYSAGQGSAFLPYAQALSKELTAAGLPSSALQSTGSIENLRKVDTEPQRLATAFMGTAYEAITGSAEWTQGLKLRNVRALFPMYETSFQVIALRSSGISTLGQLEAKRVGVGPAGGPAESFFKGLVQSRNMQVNTVNSSPSQLAMELQAGRIDALWQGASVPIPVLKQVADASDSVVFGLNETELSAMLTRFPFLARTSVPANSYKGQLQALQSVAAWNFVVCNAELSDADAYWITKTALERSAAQGADPLLATTRVDFAFTNTVLPFHAGAMRYLRERGAKLAI